MKSEELNTIIHNKLIPAQQKLIQFKKLSQDTPFRFNSKIFSECIQIIQEIIEITRGLAEFTNNDKEK